MPTIGREQNHAFKSLVHKALPVLALVVTLVILTGAVSAAETDYTPSIAWYENHQSPYTISTAEDLAGLSQIVASGTDSFKGKTILLGADIVLNADIKDQKATIKDFPSIGASAEFPFEGTFDGQGHTISGLYTSGNGLFYTGNNCAIKNVNVVDSAAICSNPITGIIIGYSLGDSTIENCHVSDSTVYVTSIGTGDVGGIAGLVTIGLLKDCSVTNCQIVCTNTDYVGGIVGYADDDSEFINCVVKDSVIISGKSGVGGILGYAFADAKFSGCTVDTCYIESIHDNYAGGIDGYGGSEAIYDGCTVSNSEVRAYKHSVGGLAGYNYHASLVNRPSTVENTIVYSEIEEYVGGFIGSTNNPLTVSTNGKCKLTNCRIVGGIEGYSTNVGIIVGRGKGVTDAGKIQISTSVIGNPNAPATTDKSLFNLAGTSVNDPGWIISINETEVVNGKTYGTPDKNFDVPEIVSDLNQKETAATPLPLAGILAGIGAVAVFLARRH